MDLWVWTCKKLPYHVNDHSHHLSAGKSQVIILLLFFGWSWRLFEWLSIISRLFYILSRVRLCRKHPPVVVPVLRRHLFWLWIKYILFKINFDLCRFRKKLISHLQWSLAMVANRLEVLKGHFWFVLEVSQYCQNLRKKSLVASVKELGKIWSNDDS